MIRLPNNPPNGMMAIEYIQTLTDEEKGEVKRRKAIWDRLCNIRHQMGEIDRHAQKNREFAVMFSLETIEYIKERLPEMKKLIQELEDLI